MQGIASVSSDSIPTAVCSATVWWRQKKPGKMEKKGPGFCFSGCLPAGVWLHPGDDGDDGSGQAAPVANPSI